MGRVKKFEKEHLLRLVNDCITYDLSEFQSLQYITAKFGREIDTKTY